MYLSFQNLATLLAHYSHNPVHHPPSVDSTPLCSPRASHSKLIFYYNDYAFRITSDKPSLKWFT